MGVNTEERDTMDYFSVIRTLYRVELLLVRMGIFQRMVFRKPDGRRKGLIFLSLSSICLLVWVYTGIVLNSSHFFLFTGLALGFSGFAESLPQERRRSAGILRTVAVGILVMFLGLLASIPELLLE